MRFPLFQEQIAACHEFDGVRKEKERLTAASLNKNSNKKQLQRAMKSETGDRTHGCDQQNLTHLVLQVNPHNTNGFLLIWVKHYGKAYSLLVTY